MHSAFTMIRLTVAAILLLPLMVHAAGLGRLTVLSALGQPLRAEIEIVSVQPGEADGLLARVAGSEAFKAAGIEFTPALVSIRAAIERRAGKPVLSLTSSQPINDPFVELLIELQWANGRLVREYTFLLDPTEYKAPAPVAEAPPPTPVAAKPAPAPAAVAAKPAASEPAAAGGYQVKRGDTLSKVARENRPSGVSINQMLAALYQANQSAFMRNNMYLMRSGQILQIPDRAAATSISAAEATRMVKAHSADFDEYRRGLGASVAVAPAKPAPPPERESPGKIAPKPAPAPKDTKDQIKLSKAEKGAAGAPATRAATGDDRVALNRALQESQSRVADLEKQIGDLQKLIELKNRQLAILEQKASGKPAAEPPKPVAAAKPAPEAPKPAAEAPKPAAPVPAPAAEAPKPAAPAAEPAKPAAKAAPAPAKAAAPSPPSPSVMDEFLDNPVALGGLAGVLALLGGYGAWAWRRKKATQSREGGFSAVAAASGFAAAAPDAARAQAAAPVAAAAVQAPVAPPVIEEVDPIAEAEVYLNYGRDAQAEAILKDALAMNPEGLPYHLKLLEIYVKRKDKAAFENSALKVKGLTGGAGADWERVVALGRAIDPENGLYGGAGGAPVAAAVLAGAAAAAAPGVDFDIGGATSPGMASPASAPASVDFDIGSIGTAPAEKQFAPGDTVVLQAPPPVAPSPPPTPAPAPAAPEPAPLDFDLDFNLGETKPEAAAAPDISSISLDLGAAGGAGGASIDPKWQEVATKLDLAKAYQEMNDKDGARELLNEVLRDGDAAQKEEANRLMGKLA